MPAGMTVAIPHGEDTPVSELMLVSCSVGQEAADGEVGLRLWKWAQLTVVYTKPTDPWPRQG